MRRVLIPMIVLLGFCGTPAAEACSCAAPGALCSAYWNTAAVFVGTVRDIQPVRERPRMLAIRFDVDQRGRGVSANTVVIEAEPQNGISCGYSFKVGVRYFVRASSTPGGQLTTGLCSGTKPASEAAEDLAFLREVSGTPRGVRVYGRVVRLEDRLVTGRRDMEGVAGARVVVEGSRSSRTMTTNPDGTYDFRELPPGTYTVRVTPPSGLAFAGPPLPADEHHPAPRPFTLSRSSECSEQSSWLRTDSRISGVILDVAGRAVVDEPVELIATANAASTAATLPHVAVRTGSDGRFEFAFVAAGEYVVGLNLKTPPRAPELDRRVYYPGVSSAVEAGRVRVEEGSRIELGVLRVPGEPLEREISGAVVSSDGAPAPGARLTLFGAGPELVRLDATGRFRLRLPYGAKFVLTAELPAIVNGRRALSRTQQHEIGRNDRDTEVTLTLGAPR